MTTNRTFKLRKNDNLKPEKRSPKRYFVNFGETQLSVIIFTQDTLKGDRLVLAFHPDSDWLWRWRGESNSWERIRSDVISFDRKKNLILIAR